MTPTTFVVVVQPSTNNNNNDEKNTVPDHNKVIIQQQRIAVVILSTIIRPVLLNVLLIQSFFGCSTITSTISILFIFIIFLSTVPSSFFVPEKTNPNRELCTGTKYQYNCMQQVLYIDPGKRKYRYFELLCLVLVLIGFPCT